MLCSRATAGRLAILAVVFLSTAVTARQGRVDPVAVWMNEQHLAADRYRSGDTAGALESLAGLTISQQRRSANAIVKWVWMRETGRTQPPAEVLAWDIQDLRGLAALYMEAALDAYENRPTNFSESKTFRDHVKLGEDLFRAVSGLARVPDAAPSWELAIGLMALADEQFLWALYVLDDGCRQFPDDIPLLVACGSIHEHISMLAADMLPGLMPNLSQDRAALGLPAASIQRARSVRDSHLDSAKRFLQHALALDPVNLEGCLRLANVLSLRGENASAVPLLEEIVGGRLKGGVRERYLALLFLARVRQRGNQIDDAAALLDAAAALIPSAQTARAARADIADLRGNTVELAGVVEQMLQSHGDSDDPWWSYRFGQYWVPGPLLVSLRRAARGGTSPTGGQATRSWRPALVHASWRRDATGSPSDQLQRFRSTADGVLVDVQVMAGGKPVAGLTADDFELLDSGVRQEIRAMTLEDVPISVLLALDVSESVKGAPLEHLKNAARTAVGALRPGDQAALLTFSHRVALASAWTEDRRRLSAAIDTLQAEGSTSLYEALIAAVGLGVQARGRVVVIVFTDGRDTSSWIDSATPIRATQRSDVVMYAVSSGRNPSRLRNVLRTSFASDPDLYPFGFIDALTDQAGGEVAYVDSTRDFAPVFQRIVSDFKSRYLLTYVPTGVPASGWHPIEVKLKGKEGTIRARRGYTR